MRIRFLNPNFIEKWDYRNVFDVGIGGSETSSVEMSMRLAARGHDVTNYVSLPSDCPDTEFGGVHWRDLSVANLDEPGLWIVYRHPQTGALFKPAANRRAWMVAQDVVYPGYRSEDAAQFDRIIGLCPRHIAFMKERDPANSGRICMSSNGVNVEAISEIENDIHSFSWTEPLTDMTPLDLNRTLLREMDRTTIRRNPKRLIWTSSPDRGLKELLDIFERAREQVSDLTLDVFYGMDNIEKICGGDHAKMPWAESWKQYDRACAMPGVTWRGRIGQRELKRELLSAGIWCYPTWFPETSCISCMEAQACGCIPITNPIWATGFNVHHGIFIEGQPNDPLVKARYVEAVVRVASDEYAQQKIRDEMMPHARYVFTWERWVTQWEEWMEADFASREAA